MPPRYVTPRLTPLPLLTMICAPRTRATLLIFDAAPRRRRRQRAPRARRAAPLSISGAHERSARAPLAEKCRTIRRYDNVVTPPRCQDDAVTPAAAARCARALLLLLDSRAMLLQIRPRSAPPCARHKDTTPDCRENHAVQRAHAARRLR